MERFETERIDFPERSVTIEANRRIDLFVRNGGYVSRLAETFLERNGCYLSYYLSGCQEGRWSCRRWSAMLSCRVLDEPVIGIHGEWHKRRKKKKDKKTVTTNTRLVCIVKESRYVGERQCATWWHNFAIGIISCYVYTQEWVRISWIFFLVYLFPLSWCLCLLCSSVCPSLWLSLSVFLRESSYQFEGRNRKWPR